MVDTTSPEGAILRADNLVAGYLPGVNILNEASLHCHEGELVGIIGPNGAGKSTLLKAMFGLVKIHDGTVVLNGKDITNLRADQLVASGVGFVPQTNNVFPSLTVSENLEMGMYLDPKKFKEVRHRHLSAARRAQGPARVLVVRW
jgi:branched-chain amino acid transport system ATP-binding protein